MNAIEDRLRDAYRAAAGTIQPGTLRELASKPARPTHARAKRRRVLIPLAAAAAVVAVVTGLALTGSLLGVGNRQPASSSSLGPGVPLFYVVVGDVAADNSLAVHDTATGRVVGRVQGPKGAVLDGTVAALAGDRTFITAAYPGSVQSDLVPPGQCLTHLYEFRINDSGQPTRLSRLPFNVPGHLNSVSVTPDGRTIAYATDLSCGPIAGSWLQIGVINTATRQARSWSLRLPAGDSFIRNVALSADGRRLSFDEGWFPADGPGSNVARTMPTNAPTGNYNQRSTVVPQSANIMWTALNADGSSVYTCSFPTLGLLGGGRKTGSVAYIINTVATGQQHLLATWPPTANPACVASLNTSGRYLLIHLNGHQVLTCPHGAAPSGTAQSPTARSSQVASPALPDGCTYTESDRLVLADLHTGKLMDLPSPRDLPSYILAGPIAW